MNTRKEIRLTLLSLLLIFLLLPLSAHMVQAEDGETDEYDLGNFPTSMAVFDENYRVLDQNPTTPYDDWFYFVPSGTMLEPTVTVDGNVVSSEYYDVSYCECMWYAQRNEWDKIDENKWIDHFPTEPGVYFCRVKGKAPYHGCCEWIDLIRITGAIEHMDIGNVWTQLSAVEGIAYTTAFDPDGVLDNKVTFVDQYWKDEDTGDEIHIGSEDYPVPGHTYRFFVTIAPKEHYSFNADKFEEFIYGGNVLPEDGYTKTLNENGSVTLEWGLTAVCDPDCSGSCGEGVTYFYDSEYKELLIFGEGAVLDSPSAEESFFRNLKGSVERITIAHGITKIGDFAFAGFEKCSQVYLQDTVNELGKGAFADTSSLTEIAISPALKTISEGAFSGSCAVNTVNYYGTEAEWNEMSIGEHNDALDAAEVHFWGVLVQVEKAAPGKDGRIYRTCTKCGKESTLSVINAPAELKLSAKSYTYNGSAKKPAVTVKDSSGDAIPAAKYTVTYKNNTNAGKATVTVTFNSNEFEGSIQTTFTIKKAANPLSVTPKTATVKYSALKKKAQTLLVSKVITFKKKGKGTVTYAKASGNSKITINKNTGKVTIKKGLKKGTYKVSVKVKAAGTANYNAATKKVTFTIKVK